MTSLITILGQDRLNQIKKEIDDEMKEKTKCKYLEHYFLPDLSSMINEYLEYDLINTDFTYGYENNGKFENTVLGLFYPHPFHKTVYTSFYISGICFKNDIILKFMT